MDPEIIEQTWLCWFEMLEGEEWRRTMWCSLTGFWMRGWPRLPLSTVAKSLNGLRLSNFLKDYDLSSEEIELGWVDGESDGGVDGAFIFINGHLLDDGGDFTWPKSNAAVDVWLITVKHHATFQQAPLDSMLATLQEFFDLSIESGALRGTYSPDLLAFRSLISQTYRRLSIGRPIINFHVLYASRGDTAQIGESVRARAKQIEATIGGLFSSCAVILSSLARQSSWPSSERPSAFL